MNSGPIQTRQKGWALPALSVGANQVFSGGTQPTGSRSARYVQTWCDVLSRGNQGGFTLIELVMVLVLVAIIGAATSIRWQSPAEYTAAYQADLLARNIRHMQALAMSWDQTLQLNTSGTTYSVTCASGSTVSPCNGANPVDDPSAGGAFQVVLQNNVTLSGPATLDVDSLGRPVTGGTIVATNPAATITLTGGGKTPSVTVLPVTGFVTVSY